MTRIYKPRHGRIIDGVCAGVARYIGIDAIWVRIGWAALSLAGGIGVLAYILAMYLFPRAESDAEEPPARDRGSSGPLVAGILLIAVAVLFILRATGVLYYGFWGAWHVAWVVLWPISLIGGGLLLLLAYWRQSSGDRPELSRPVGERMIMGVCAALGDYLKTDPNLIRFAFALMIILSRGVALIVYIVIGLLTPEAKDEAGEA